MDRFRTSPAIKPFPIWTAVLWLAIWLALCIAAAAAVVVLNVREVEKDLVHFGDAYSDHLNQKMVSSETVLKGFSSLFAAVGRTDPASAKRYVRQAIENTPQIFALEIVQRVPREELDAFVADRRRSGLPDFAVKSFSYDLDRKWQAPRAKPVYYPIVFMEPMPAGSEDVLGLDMGSVPFLWRAMAESIQRQAAIASHPFRLVEGNLAYVVFRPISQTPAPVQASTAVVARAPLVVAMVIDAAKLAEPVARPVFDGGTILIHHNAFDAADPHGQLLALEGSRRSAVERALFPRFAYEKPLATLDGSFVLRITQQVGWSDLSLGLLALVVLLTLLSSLMLLAFLRTRQHGRLLQIENQQRLWMIANHDSLTGLPNRMLLLDRLEQSLSRARRQSRRMAVMFLDLDDFKQVNDRHGHAAGDQLLRSVAERLRTAVRADDTVARISGDEFVVLLDNVETSDTLNVIHQKIQDRLAEALMLDGQRIVLRASVGMAVFPDDGDDADALMRLADMRMYADKPAGAGRT